jgi:hypothetical protein
LALKYVVKHDLFGKLAGVERQIEHGELELVKLNQCRRQPVRRRSGIGPGNSSRSVDLLPVMIAHLDDGMPLRPHAPASEVSDWRRL